MITLSGATGPDQPREEVPARRICARYVPKSGAEVR